MLALFAILFAAIVPTYLYVRLFYWADRYEREPRWLATVAFVWGAIPAVIASLIGEMILSVPIGDPAIMSDSLLGVIIEDAIYAPIIEEVTKGFALLLIFWFVRREFDGVLDGLIYGALIGFGFAMTENLFYFIGAFDEGGFGNLAVVILLRTVIFGLNHALYTGLTGIGLGFARNATTWVGRLIWPLVGLTAAILAHGLHNFGASLASQNGAALLISLGVAAGGCCIVLLTILLSWQYERNCIRAELAEEIGVTLTLQEYENLIKRWRNPLRRPKNERAEADRMHLYAKLALNKSRLRRLGAEREPALPAQIGQIRAQLAM